MCTLFQALVSQTWAFNLSGAGTIPDAGYAFRLPTGARPAPSRLDCSARPPVRTEFASQNSQLCLCAAVDEPIIPVSAIPAALSPTAKMVADQVSAITAFFTSINDIPSRLHSVNNHIMFLTLVPAPGAWTSARAPVPQMPCQRPHRRRVAPHPTPRACRGTQDRVVPPVTQSNLLTFAPSSWLVQLPNAGHVSRGAVPPRIENPACKASAPCQSSLPRYARLPLPLPTQSVFFEDPEALLPLLLDFLYSPHAVNSTLLAPFYSDYTTQDERDSPLQPPAPSTPPPPPANATREVPTGRHRHRQRSPPRLPRRLRAPRPLVDPAPVRCPFAPA